MERTVLAFLVAPLAIPFVFLCVFLVGPLFSGSSNNSYGAKDGSALVGVLLFSIYGIVIAYLCEATFGIAAWIIFRRLGIRSTLAFAAAGAIMGWLFSALTSKRFADVSNPYFWIDMAAGICCCGLFRLVVFSGSGVGQPK
jgi:hypothetical protein